MQNDLVKGKSLLTHASNFYKIIDIVDISDVKRIHSIGDGLKEIKTTLNRDIKLNVAGVKIEGAEGEVVNAPQWVGKILSDSNYVSLELPDMISELKQSLSKEKMIGEYNLSTLDQYFYIKLKAEMDTLDRYDFDRTESMMLELFRKRRGKLIKMADTTELNAELYNKLTVEEVAFYRSMRDGILKFELQIRGKDNEH